MGKLNAVVRREYLARVRSKWFIFTTLLAPVLLAGVVALPMILAVQQANRVLHISVIDGTGELVADVLRTEPFTDGRFRYIPPPAGNVERAREELRERVLREELAGYLYIPADVLESRRIEYWGWEGASPSVTEPLKVAASSAVNGLQARELGIDYEDARRITRTVTVEAYRVTGAGAAREEEHTVVAAHVLGLLIYVVVLMYGAMMLRAAVAEKTTRTVEIILSSVRPWELMLGKILGVGAVGLTQVAIWVAVLLMLLLYAGASQALGDLDLLRRLPVGIDTLILFVVLFVSGYFLYAGMYASVGAIASSEQEASQLQIPVTLFLVIPILVIPVVLDNPGGDVALVLSWVPLFTPVLFLVRHVLGATAGWELPVILALQLMGILAVAWVGGRIYRVGLLMTGKRPTLPELIRWVRHG